MTRSAGTHIVRMVQSTDAVAALAWIAGAASNPPVASLEARATSPVAAVSGDSWITGLKGTHRQLFDAPNPAGGTRSCTPT